MIAWGMLALPTAVGAWAYAGYPAALWLAARGRRPPPSPQPAGDAEWPMVSIVIPAYNEEAQIRGAIESALGQDYPESRRQILILSDASTDATDDIVREYAAQGVELLRMPQRSGKTAAENASIPHLRGEIVVNTDSSIRFHPAVVRELVRRMLDPSVGVASGRDVSIALQDSSANVAEAGYVGYEMWVRALETRTGGIVGASGSGYAIRADLHAIPIRQDLSRDFSAALTAHRHGYRAVSVDEALCYVPRTASLQREYHRKVRTISRGMDTLYNSRHLLNPTRYGAFAWKLLSHKIARWLLPPAAAVGVVGLALLAREQRWAAVALALVGVGMLLALVGAWWPEGRARPRLLSVAAFGVAANVAVLHAIWRVLNEQHDHIWEPTRRTGPAAR